MLTFKRGKKIRGIRTPIPKPPRLDVKKAVEMILDSPRPDVSLEAIRSTRVFLDAKIKGTSDSEAKALAGISNNVTKKQIFENPIAKKVLEELLESEPVFSDPGILKRLKEMWHHKRVRFQKVGDDVETVHEDDTDLWKYSMDTVLELRKYKNNKEKDSESNVITSVVFNVQPVPAAPVIVQEVSNG